MLSAGIYWYAAGYDGSRPKARRDHRRHRQDDRQHHRDDRQRRRNDRRHYRDDGQHHRGRLATPPGTTGNITGTAGNTTEITGDTTGTTGNTTGMRGDTAGITGDTAMPISTTRYHLTNPAPSPPPPDRHNAARYGAQWRASGSRTVCGSGSGVRAPRRWVSGGNGRRGSRTPAAPPLPEFGGPPPAVTLRENRRLRARSSFFMSPVCARAAGWRPMFSSGETGRRAGSKGCGGG